MTDRKNTIILIIAGFLAATIWAISATRDNLYSQFGPRSWEATVLVMHDALNEIRAQIGMPTNTVQETIDAINARIQTISAYEWEGQL